MAFVAAAESSPMDEINMTPLIDVMLVLLVMFIITIPLQTHAVKLDLPAKCEGCPVPQALKNKLVITSGGAILWNGTAVSKQDVRFLLVQTARMKPQPELHFQPEANARWDLVDEVLAMTKRAGVKRMGFVGNETYQSF
jgi:biopolymer transport protein ExbD